MRTMALAALLFLTVATSLPAQDLSETLEIRVTNVDVVVTDSQGRPVRDLTRDDFELFENGRRVEITNFFEEAAPLPPEPGAPAEATPAEAEAPVVRRPRRIVVFVDQTTLMPFDVNRAIDSLKTFLATIAGDGDRVMVGAWNDGFRVIHPFSSDIDAINASLESLRSNAAMSLHYARRFTQLQQALDNLVSDGEATGIPPTYAEGLSEVRSYAEEITQRQRRMIQTLESLSASMAGLEGRKAIVLLTGGTSMYPGRDGFVYFDGVKQFFDGGSGQQPRTEAGHFRLTNEFEATIRRANSAGVAIHALRGSAMSADMAGADLRPSAIGGVAAASEAKMESDSDRIVSMQALANETGGTMVNATNDIGEALARVVDDFTSYYSLGYRTGAPDAGARKIDVRVKRAGLRVRHRTAVVDRSITEEMQQRLSSALAFPELGLGMNLQVRADTAVAGAEGRVVIPVTIMIPTEELTLLPEAENLRGSFQVYTAFMRGNGVVSKIDAQDQGFSFPAESRSRRRFITLKLDVEIDSATERVAVGIVDGPSQLSGVAVLDLARSDVARR